MSRRGEAIQADVLDVLRCNRGPLSAYKVLAELQKINPKIVTMTIYRSLAALIDQGRVHRLESLNTFVACQCDGHKHASIMSICDDCGTVEENVEPDVLSKLSIALGKNGFASMRHVIEVHGMFATCGTGQARA